MALKNLSERMVEFKKNSPLQKCVIYEKKYFYCTSYEIIVTLQCNSMFFRYPYTNTAVNIKGIIVFSGRVLLAP